MTSIAVLILTYNEQHHIERCIKSLLTFTNNIFVVDSYSTDNTVSICEGLGVKVYQRKWKNYADQFQWGLDNCPIETEWVMRMDADEYIEQDLIDELINKNFSLVKPEISGFYIRRKYFFLGQWIKYGAVYPLNLLRIWRTGQGRIENRWMDEHIVLSRGTTSQLSGHIIDDNLNNTRWWTEKHNNYADREMLDILDKKYSLFTIDDSLKENKEGSQAKFKRTVKEGVYNKLPIFVRPLLYFLYRYFIRFGFLDGKKGFAFHFFQGYWYRSLVDLRVYEAEMNIANLPTNGERINWLEKFTGLTLR
ncbi:glycosyltransferase family 2 protein [Shewanella litoralis]|uniref:Glycosyl transferase n=1 Tax=Shewanella litoralis TaxID=2282700 RepID=A0ABQ2R6Q3_9GAMM|nr:glycosyltransferase family 2 protein [Shewanella litoralis]GGQ16676.1 glycosyl transferase [Shewanella litoralis]